MVTRGAGLLSGRPILGGPRDGGLLTGRDDELTTARNAIERGLNCVIVGPAGAGRTSVLNVLCAELPEPAVMLSGRVCRRPDELLLALGMRIAPERALPTSGGKLDIDAAIDVLASERKGPPAIVALDDPSPETFVELFGRRRDELWAIDAIWLTTLDSIVAHSVLQPPADVFFDVRIDLPPLSDDAAADLLHRRTAELDAAELQRIVVAAQGLPRRLLNLAARPESAGSIAERERRLAECSEPARRLASALETLDGASASDPALLELLGWTRTRVVQVLAELRGAQLVEETTRAGEHGRPRKVFRLIAL